MPALTAAAADGSPMQSSQMLVIVPPHPLVGHWIAVARNKYSPSPMFRNALAELGRILIYEAVREWLPVVEAQIETPLAIADVTVVDTEKPIKVSHRPHKPASKRAGDPTNERASEDCFRTAITSSERY